MANISLADAKKLAIKDINNSKNFLVITVDPKEIKRHMLIDNPIYSIAVLRTIKEVENAILFPAKPSQAPDASGK